MKPTTSETLRKIVIPLLIGLFLALGFLAVRTLPKVIHRIAKPQAFSSYRAQDHPSGFAFPLRDGRFLLVGSGPGTRASQSEFLDPSTLEFSAAPAPRHDRSFHPVGTLLKNGDPLLAGGPPNSKANSILESFDVAAGRWVELDRLPDDVRLADALCLKDGRVLFTTNDGGQQGLLVWDPVRKSLRNAGHRAMCVNGSPLASMLQDGKVLITHLHYGETALETTNAFLFDPETNETLPLHPMALSRSQHQTSPLADGRVLITGGADGEPSAEVFDPATRTFTPTGPMVAPRSLHRSVVLPDGRVLIAGGVSSRKDSSRLPFTDEELTMLQPEELARRMKEHYKKHPPKHEPLASEIEIFDPRTGQFSPVPEPPEHLLLGDGPRGGLHAERADGDVLFLAYGGPLRFQPKSRTWSSSKEHR